MNTTDMNKAYCNTINAISNQLNDFFTKTGWTARFGKACGVIYYNYLNKLDNCDICLDDYNQFDILVGEKYTQDYIKSHSDVIITNKKFFIKFNDMNVLVNINDKMFYEYQNDIKYLNNINVIYHKKIFEYMKSHIERNIFNKPHENVEFNAESIQKSIKEIQINYYKLNCVIMFDKINKLMDEKEAQDKTASTTNYMTRRHIPIVPKTIENVSLLLEAATYIENTESVEPPAKRK